MGEIVKFHNDTNKVFLGDLSEREADLLFAIFQKLKNRSNKTLIFSDKDLKLMLGKNYNLKDNELTRIVKGVWENIKAANFWILLPRREENVMLFSKFAINYFNDEKTKIKDIEISVNKEFEYLLNNFIGNFTSFELEEFQCLSSKYSKTLYRLLKQYKTTGYVYLYWDNFIGLMNISLKSSQCNVNKIVSRACFDLGETTLFDSSRIPFENLTYEKIKGAGRGRGGKVVGIEFKFKPQKADYKLTKNQEIKMLREENEEYAKNYIIDSMAREQNEQLKEEILDMQKQIDGVGLNAYKGLMYYSPKQEVIEIKDIEKIKNSSDSAQYKVILSNSTTNKEFSIYCDSISHLLNIVKKNEFDFAPYNDEILKKKQ